MGCDSTVGATRDLIRDFGGDAGVISLIDRILTFEGADGLGDTGGAGACGHSVGSGSTFILYSFGSAVDLLKSQ